MSKDLPQSLTCSVGKQRFGTILADPPWQFQNRTTGKMAPEHRRLSRYGTMTLSDIMALPVQDLAASRSHLYLWVPNALLPEGIYWSSGRCAHSGCRMHCCRRGLWS